MSEQRWVEPEPDEAPSSGDGGGDGVTKATHHPLLCQRRPDSPPTKMWYWLLTPDGRPAMGCPTNTTTTTDNNNNNASAALVVPAPDEDHEREWCRPDGTTSVSAEPVAQQPLYHDHNNKPRTTDSRDATREVIPSTWRWLLNPDGSPEMATASFPRREADRTDLSISTRSAAATAPEISSNESPIAEAIPSSAAAIAKPSPRKPSPPDCRKPGTGRPAIVGARASRRRRDRVRIIVDPVPLSSSSVPETTTGWTQTKNNDDDDENHDGDPRPSTWYWHLAPDGSYATAGRPTVPASGKRKRDPLEEAGRESRRPFRKAPIIDDMESDDYEDNSTDIGDEDFSMEDDDELSSDCWMDDMGTTRKNDSVNHFVRSSSCYRQKEFDAQWDAKFELLVGYKKKHGTTRVPGSEPVLGTWVKLQRVLYRKKRLLGCRYERLISIGFEWSIGHQHRPWMERFNHLRAFKKRHNGSTNVPTRQNGGLGQWVRKQRVDYSKDKISEQRKSLLNSIGFEWRIRGSYDRNYWFQMYRRLVAYQKKHKSTRVPKGSKEHSKLCKWVTTQRYNCKEKYRIDLLNEIGFDWNPFRQDWFQMYERLVAYKKKHGNTLVPRSFEDDRQLANWVNAQRQSCKESDRIDLLNAIGFVWDARTW